MATNGIAEAFTRGELDQFEALLLERRALLLGDVQALEQEESGDSSGLSHVSTHLADLGSDRASSDISLGYRESASGEIQDIDEALRRIGEGSYGHCETCDKPISRERLEAIPYARLCLPCKKEEER
jgi:DnaK suppressor protein